MKEITPGELRRREGFQRWLNWLKDPEVVEERFWERVDKRGPDDCWPWMAGLSHKYGRFRFRKKNWMAHRVAFVLLYGDFDFSLDVLHRCDHPPCCNGRHLFLGTAHDNMQDSISKGRWKQPIPQPGELNPQHKLTQDQVFQIRALHTMGGITQRAIAKRFQIDYRTVNQIVLRVTWAHI